MLLIINGLLAYDEVPSLYRYDRVPDDRGLKDLNSTLVRVYVLHIHFIYDRSCTTRVYHGAKKEW